MTTTQEMAAQRPSRRLELMVGPWKTRAMPVLEEKSYRLLVDETFARVDRAFEAIDPDMGESNVAQGSLTITFRNKLRLILSPQPSPRQLWVAFRDRAWHFDWNDDKKCWLDDRGQGIELGTLLKDLTRQEIATDLPLS